MAGLFSSPKMPAVQPTPPPPTATDPSATQAAQALAQTQAQARGAASTLLTGGQGTAAPTTDRKTLLGQ